MIKIPTVFVLGAGASRPYGYPLGSELKKTICDQLSNDESGLFKKLRSLDFGESDIAKFRSALFYSGKSSVDAFLEHRREFIEIGKSVIAYSLIVHEDQEDMFRIGNWYEYFYNRLKTPSLKEFDQNKISIITFNYDRSLEHYLFTALKNTFGERTEACASKLNNISIVHVYGQLGSLPWQTSRRSEKIIPPWEDDTRPYKPTNLSVEDLEKAASGIRIIHENEDIREDPKFTEAHSLICKATKVHFLGFGYDETNVKRLNVSCDSKDRPKKYLGTVYGLKKAEKSRVGHQFSGNNADIDFTQEGVDTLGFLRQEAVLE
jgi:hypothetical protein